MKLIVGLGNPGLKYALTRHNIGFIVIDALIQELNLSNKKEECQAITYKARIGDEEVLFVKPQTFMNLSGTSVQGLMAFYKCSLDDILVLHDEVDIPFNKMRFQRNRGHGGHNGIRDIHAKVGSDYARLKIGVGRPTVPQMEVADYVLQKFSNENMSLLSDFVGRAAEAVLSFIEDGFQKAQNKFNVES
ncbi:MAG: aminoacyl-tRNA hydrolase [Bdellovibrionota bacterium]